MELQFFHRKIPVYGEPEPVVLGDTECKFWWFDCCGPGFVMRTMKENGEWRPLQERFDEWLWKDAKAMDARPIFKLRGVFPAPKEITEGWLRLHPYQAIHGVKTHGITTL